MRTFSILALVLAFVLSAPAFAGEPAVLKTVDLGSGHTMTYQLNPEYKPFQPEYTQFTVSTQGKSVVTTMGDPILVLGGKKVGVWPYKHLTYKFKGGLEITGHADAENGNVHSMEVFRPDGTMLMITGMGTGKLKVQKYSQWATWAFRKLQKKTFVLDLSN